MTDEDRERLWPFAVVLALVWFMTGPTPPVPPLDSDGAPLRLRSLGMRACPACGGISNDSHRRLCRGPVKTS